MSRVVKAVVVAVIGVFAYWYFSPFLAIHSMKSAAKAGDAEVFSQFIDYPKVRESMKGQMKAILATKVSEASNSDNPYEKAGAALGSMMGNAMIENLVEGLVQPSNIMKFITNMKMENAAKEYKGEAGEKSEKSESTQKWATRRIGTDKLIAYDSAAASSNAASFVFERNGFANWKLTEVRFPEPTAGD